MTLPIIAALSVARREQRLTQAEVGLRIGRNGRALSDWERGASSPPASDLFRLANVLGFVVTLQTGRRCEHCGRPPEGPAGELIGDARALLAALRRVRLTLNLTITQAADRGGIHRATVERWECGLVPDPHLFELNDYIDGLGCSLTAEPIPSVVAS